MNVCSTRAVNSIHRDRDNRVTLLKLETRFAKCECARDTSLKWNSRNANVRSAISGLTNPPFPRRRRVDTRPLDDRINRLCNLCIFAKADENQCNIFFFFFSKKGIKPPAKYNLSPSCQSFANKGSRGWQSLAIPKRKNEYYFPSVPFQTSEQTIREAYNGSTNWTNTF